MRSWLAAALLLALVPAAAAGDLPEDFPRHALVFSSHSDVARQDYDIWQCSPDGGQLASLVVLPGSQYSFDLSPDGEQVVYAYKEGDGELDLYLRAYHRGEAERLTDHPARDSGPRFSPDGKRLAFFSTRDGGKPELYTMDLETREPTRHTDNEWHESGASWSPGGTRVAFTRFHPSAGDDKREGNGSIVIVDLASGEEQVVVGMPGYNGGVDWSPDGEHLAWHRVHEGAVEIYVAHTDGSGAVPITSGYLDEYSPAWSPGGDWIAYTAGTGNDGQGTFDLYVMRADGSDVHRVGAWPNTQMEPRWRPGDHHIR